MYKLCHFNTILLNIVSIIILMKTFQNPSSSFLNVQNVIIICSHPTVQWYTTAFCSYLTVTQYPLNNLFSSFPPRCFPQSLVTTVLLSTFKINFFTFQISKIVPSLFHLIQSSPVPSMLLITGYTFQCVQVTHFLYTFNN